MNEALLLTLKSYPISSRKRGECGQNKKDVFGGLLNDVRLSIGAAAPPP
jgi:hypothetical protein